MSVPLISQVWVFRASGIPIMNRAYGSAIEIDESLLTSLLSALILFAEDLKQGTLKALRMTNLTLFVNHERGMLFAIGAKPPVLESLMWPIIEQIKRLFFQIFPEKLLEKGDMRPHLIPSSIQNAFGKKLDQLINIKARNLSHVSDFDLNNVNQTFLALARNELSPSTAIDELLDTFSSVESETAKRLVMKTISEMLSVSEQVAAKSPLQKLLKELNRFLELWGKTAKISILGLDRAGKTALLNTIQGRDYHTTPTTTPFIEHIKFRNLTFACWDMPGQEMYRPQWIPNTRGTHVLIFVVDGADPQRWDEAIQALKEILEKFPKIPFGFLLNKADLPMYAGKAAFHKIVSSILNGVERPFRVFETSAITGEGLETLFFWIFNQVAESLTQQKVLRTKHELPLAPLDRFLRAEGAERVSLEATETLRDILENLAVTLSKSAVELANFTERNTILEKDIELAFKYLRKKS